MKTQPQVENKINSIEYYTETSIGANFKYGNLRFFTAEHPIHSKPAIERITKCVNNEWKIDMYQDLIFRLAFVVHHFGSESTTTLSSKNKFVKEVEEFLKHISQK